MISMLTVSVGFALMICLLFLGLHVATALFGTAFIAIVFFFDGVHLRVFGSQLWSSMEDYILLAIPLYILLGEILVRSGMTDKMYAALSPWLNRLPGGLLHTNIGASAIFSAVSGSSVSTAATITTVALPSFRKRDYDERLVLGSIAAGASLGNLIPPGIAFIVYASLTSTSVAQLYAAALVPSIVLAVMFMLTIAFICLIKPDLARSNEPYVPWIERFKLLGGLLGPAVVFVIIMGSIYTGWATVTESAALAVVATMIIAACQGRLSIAMLHGSFVTTASLTAISMLILVVAFYLNYSLALLNVTQTLSMWVAGLGVDQLTLKWALAIFYVLLGIFFETLPMMVGTVPVLLPVILAAGIDPVWFGVFIVLMCEMSLLTPPVGMTLYVIQTVRKVGNIGTVFAGTIPFIFTMLLMMVLLIHFPQIATWAIPTR